MFTEGSSQQGNENEKNSGEIPLSEGMDYESWVEQQQRPIESWMDKHSRWRKEEAEEEARTLKKYAPVAALCLLAAGGYIYYENTRAKREIENEPKDYVNFALKYSNLNPQQQANLEQALKQIQGIAPEGKISYLKKRGEDVERLRPSVPPKPTISNFETIGVEAEDLEPVFNEKFFPAGFLGGNISRIEYEGKTISGIGWTSVEAQANFNDKTGNYISFYRPSMAIFNETGNDENSPVNNIWPVLIHEMGHESDWASKMSLTPEERALFLFEAEDVFTSYRKYNSPLASIASPEDNVRLRLKNSNAQQDKKIFLDRVLNEWWAELCTGYLEFPNVFAMTASDREKNLIERWLVKGDKKFNNIKAREERHKVWAVAKDKIYRKLVKKGLDSESGFRMAPKKMKR